MWPISAVRTSIARCKGGKISDCLDRQQSIRNGLPSLRTRRVGIRISSYQYGEPNRCNHCEHCGPEAGNVLKSGDNIVLLSLRAPPIPIIEASVIHVEASAWCPGKRRGKSADAPPDAGSSRLRLIQQVSGLCLPQRATGP